MTFIGARSRWHTALLLVLVGAGAIAACGGEEGGVTRAPEEDAGVAMDAAAPPPPAPDAAVPPPPPPDAGVPPVPACPCDFIEEFTEPTRIEASETTAVLETSSPGTLSAPAGRMFESVGTGSEGALSVVTSRTLSPGTHEYSAIDLRGATVQIAGSATLRVTGPINLSGAASLEVAGDLTLVAGGDLTVDCSRIVATGALRIHQPTGGITVRCAQAGERSRVITDYTPDGTSGSIQIWTRGAFRLNGAADLYTGSINAPTQSSGDLEIRAYGDVNLGPGDGLVITGGSRGENGDLSIYSEGQVRVDRVRVAGGDSSSTSARGGTVLIRARGAVSLDGGGNVLSSPGGSVDVVTESALTLEGTSSILTPSGGARAAATHIRLRARSVRIGSTQDAADGSAVIARAGEGRASTLEIEAIEDVSILGQATVGTPPVPCLPAGDVTVRAEKNVSLAAGAFLKAGDSTVGTGCTAQKGGSLVVSAGGTITTMNAVTAGGLGTPAGDTTVRGSENVQLGVLAAELQPLLQATSRPLAIEGVLPMPGVTAVSFRGAAPPSYPGLHLLLSGAGAPFSPTRTLPSPIQDGWRYRVLLEPRMFDPVTLDGFSIAYR